MAGKLALFQCESDGPSSKDFIMLQNQWKRVLDPLAANPSNNSVLVKNVLLAVGANVINHLLGRTPQGWKVVDVNGVATLYRSQPFNDKTLTLTSSAVVTISLEVF